MEKGHEGDEIVILSFRQILCAIPENVYNMNQLTAEMIYDIASRAYVEIIRGDISEIKPLPANIASRHRLCTILSKQIKELGFPGECGYNQLLYPVESQTRALLNWLVVRLPRTEDETVEPDVDRSTLRQQKILAALQSWKSELWKPPCCTASVTARRNVSQPYRTLLSSNKTVSLDDLMSARDKRSVSSGSIATSIIERHAAQLGREQMQQHRPSTVLRSDIPTASMSSDGFVSSGLSIEQLRRLTSSASSVMRADVRGEGEGGKAWGASLQGMSLTELVHAISERGGRGGSVVEERRRGSLDDSSTEFADKQSNLHPTTPPVPSPDMSSGEAEGEEGDVDQATEAAVKAKEEEEEEERRKEMDLANLKNELTLGRTQVDAMSERFQTVSREVSARIRIVQAELAELSVRGERLEAEVLVSGRAMQMLATRSLDNIETLKALCSESVSRLLALAQEWETHRVPLVTRLEGLLQAHAERRARSEGLQAAARRMTDELPVLAHTLRERRERGTALSGQLDSLPKNLSRTMYTHRILDIIASIGKQDDEIEKVAADIRTIQKTISNTEQALSRADTVTEEKIYAMANGPARDTAAIEAYKLLSSFRSSFTSLLEKVGRMGKLESSSRDLVNKIDQESTRVSSNGVEAILHDLESMRSENRQLAERVQQLASTARQPC